MTISNYSCETKNRSVWPLLETLVSPLADGYITGSLQISTVGSTLDVLGMESLFSHVILGYLIKRKRIMHSIKKQQQQHGGSWVSHSLKLSKSEV